MAGFPRSARVALIVGAGVVIAAVLLANPVGRWVLQRPLAGGSCEPVTELEGLEFRSAINSENQFVNGAMIRSLRADPSPDCTVIGNSFRCTQVGPTIVQIRLTRGPELYYAVPDGAEATVFGGPRDAFCVITSDRGGP